MTVPKYMIDKLRYACYHYRLGAQRMIEFEEWLDRKGIDPEELRVADGNGLEEIEYGNDVVAEVVERISRLV